MTQPKKADATLDNEFQAKQKMLFDEQKALKETAESLKQCFQRQINGTTEDHPDEWKFFLLETFNAALKIKMIGEKNK